MKLSKSKITKRLSVVLVVFAYIGYIASCTNDDQILDEFVHQPSGPSFSETELVSLKVTTPPVMDGTIDNIWDQAQPLKARTVVPAIGAVGNVKVKEYFWGYHGKAYNVTLRSLYDDTYLYILAEWDDNSDSQDRETWYFDPNATLPQNKWKQENRYGVFNADGVMTRDAFYEDKFAFLWNINNSVSDWNQKTCYATCHVQSATQAVQGLARHYTNSETERVDMWHWKRVREGTYGTLDDQFQWIKGQSFAGKESQGRGNTTGTDNGRYSDAIGTAGTGYSNNSQTLTIQGTETTMTVPKYFIPDETYYYYITKEDINSGKAKLITGVDSDGVLYYNEGAHDPNTDGGCHRDGMRSGPKGIPSIIVNGRIDGSAGDIDAHHVHNGSQWTLEIRRKLNTGDALNDVDFSSLEDQYFGIGVFENAAIAHAIKGNLVLKFKK